MAKISYSDIQINEYLELAQEIGLTRAKRQLGYPSSWATAKRWADNRGVEVPIDELKAKAAEIHDWYKTEDIMAAAQEGIHRVYEELTSNDSLTPDDFKKLAEALMKNYDVWAKAQGKATAITETKTEDSFSSDLIDLINSEKAKNALKSADVT